MDSVGFTSESSLGPTQRTSVKSSPALTVIAHFTRLTLLRMWMVTCLWTHHAGYSSTVTHAGSGLMILLRALADGRQCKDLTLMPFDTPMAGGSSAPFTGEMRGAGAGASASGASWVGCGRKRSRRHARARGELIRSVIFILGECGAYVHVTVCFGQLVYARCSRSMDASSFLIPIPISHSCGVSAMSHTPIF